MMKVSKSLRVWVSAIVVLALISLCGCSKGKNANPFQIYFYTTNKTMAPLYLTYNNKLVGKLKVLDKDPLTLDSTLLSVISFDALTEINGIQANGQVIETFDYTLNDDGSYKEGGGGYLLYDTWHKEKYCLLIRVNGQF